MLDEQPVDTTLYSLGTQPPAPPERRSSERYLSLLRVGALIVGGRRELCLIKNISAGGMLIRAYSDIEEGSVLSVELKQGEAVTGRALWTRGEQVGVEFDQPIDVISLISGSTDGLRPRMPRIEVHCTAWVRDGANVHRTRAVNISQGGVRLEAPTDLPIGTDVVVTLPGLAPEPGVVRWANSEACGITFNRVLALTQLVGWLGERQERQSAAN